MSDVMSVTWCCSRHPPPASLSSPAPLWPPGWSPRSSEAPSHRSSCRPRQRSPPPAGTGAAGWTCHCPSPPPPPPSAAVRRLQSSDIWPSNSPGESPAGRVDCLCRRQWEGELSVCQCPDSARRFSLTGRAVAGVLRIYLVRIVHEGCLGVCIKVRSILLIARSEIIVLARLQKSNSASLHCCLICCLLGLVGDDRPLHYRFFCYNRLTWKGEN